MRVSSGLSPLPATVGLALGLLASGGLTADQERHAAPSGPAVAFVDAAGPAGLDFVHVNGASDDKYFVESMGSGGLFFDFDNDGLVDIFLVDGGSLADPAVARQARHRLYRNRGDGTFEDVTARSGIVHREYGQGACAADVDNDGWVDLYITNYGPNLLYRNNGDGTFTDVTQRAGVAAAPELWSTSCAFTDVDRDGHVDLFFTNYVDAPTANNVFCGNTRPLLRIYCGPLSYSPQPSVLFRNNGDGTFRDVSAESGIGERRANGLGVAVADIDGDGWPDIFVANDGVADYLYRNLGHGRFEEIGLLAGVAVGADGKPRAGMGTAFGDYTGDGRFDLIVTNYTQEMHTLFRNLGDRLFTDTSLPSGVGPVTRPHLGFGVAFLDYDHDGRLDLAIANGHVIDNNEVFRPGSPPAPERNLLLRNLGGGRFVEVGRRSGAGFAIERISRGLFTADIDNDGDLDILITNNGGRADLLINQGGSRQPALLVRTVGTTSNRDGIGARLTLTAGGVTQVREVGAGSSYLGQNDMRVHFGLGGATAVDQLEVRWPSGHTEVVRPESGHIITIREGDGIIDATPFRR